MEFNPSFTNAVSNSGHITLDDWMIVNDELKSVRKKMVIVKFKVIRIVNDLLKTWLLTA
jgi:hypothetical protein